MLWVFIFAIALKVQTASAISLQPGFFDMHAKAVYLANDTLPGLNDLHVQQVTTGDSISEADSLPKETLTIQREAVERTTPTHNSIRDVSLRIEQFDYFYQRDGLSYNDEQHLFFRITSPDPIAEVRVYPVVEQTQVEGLALLPSADFFMLDSLVFVNNDHYRARVRFTDLFDTSFPSMIFRYKSHDQHIINHEIPLFPYFVTSLMDAGSKRTASG